MNRTLVEAARSMLSISRLPPKFWAEALSTAVYLHNRSPTKAVSGMTPQEAWTGEKPSVDHLRVFGCQSYAYIPKDERKKLDSKSKKCVLLGYGSTSKGYGLYDPAKKKVMSFLMSRNLDMTASIKNQSPRGLYTFIALMSPANTVDSELCLTLTPEVHPSPSLEIA